jgi:cytochrome c-type biogenesis protein CcmH/NrfG
MSLMYEKAVTPQQGLRLRLVREVSWANVRDRVAVGHFDAAQMLGPMVLASNLGLWPEDSRCSAPAALGASGNAITVSTALWLRRCEYGAQAGARPDVQARALAGVVAARARAGFEPLTLAMVFPFSCHHYQLRDWLAMGKIDPERDVAYLGLARIFRDMGRFDESESYARALVKIQPTNPEAQAALGDTLIERNKLSEAESVFRAALRLDPNSSTVLSGLGNTLNRAGKLREALQLLRSARERDPSSQPITYNLAVVVERLGDAEGAKKLYEASLKID